MNWEVLESTFVIIHKSYDIIFNKVIESIIQTLQLIYELVKYSFSRTHGSDHLLNGVCKFY